MAVFRTVKNRNYTVMSNYHLRDKNLSLKSKGLLSFMLSLPEDWKYSLKGLAAISKDGIYVIRNCVKELEKYGYVQRRKARNDKGQMIDVEYIIYEQPVNLKNIRVWKIQHRKIRHREIQYWKTQRWKTRDWKTARK